MSLPLHRALSNDRCCPPLPPAGKKACPCCRAPVDERHVRDVSLLGAAALGQQYLWPLRPPSAPAGGGGAGTAPSSSGAGLAKRPASAAPQPAGGIIELRVFAGAAAAAAAAPEPARRTTDDPSAWRPDYLSPSPRAAALLGAADLEAGGSAAPSPGAALAPAAVPPRALTIRVVGPPRYRWLRPLLMTLAFLALAAVVAVVPVLIADNRGGAPAATLEDRCHACFEQLAEDGLLAMATYECPPHCDRYLDSWIVAQFS